LGRDIIERFSLDEIAFCVNSVGVATKASRASLGGKLRAAVPTSVLPIQLRLVAGFKPKAKS
jgi:hypothetical protein